MTKTKTKKSSKKSKNKQTLPVNPYTFKSFIKRKHVPYPNKRTVRLAKPKMLQQKYIIKQNILQMKKNQRNQYWIDELKKPKKKKPPKNFSAYIKMKKLDLPTKYLMSLAVPKKPIKKYSEHLKWLQMKQKTKDDYWRRKTRPNCMQKMSNIFKRNNKCPKRVSHLARKPVRYI